MRAQNRGRRHGTDLAFKARFDRLRLTRVRHYRKNFFRLENLAHRHRNGLGRHLRQVSEPGFAHLLLPAGFVKRDDQVRVLDLKISRRVVEGKMPILANAQKRDSIGAEARSFPTRRTTSAASPSPSNK